MHLKSIQIQNFRCFEDLTVDFEDDLTVFVAMNGGGKTTLMDAIAAAFEPWVIKLLQRNLPQISIKDLRRNPDGSRAGDLRVQIVALNEMNWQIIPEVVDVPDEDQTLYTNWNAWGSSLESLDRIRESVSKDSHSEVEVPVIAYYRSTRNLANAPKVGNKDRQFPRLDVWLTALDAVANYQDVIDWFHSKEVEEFRKNREHPEKRIPLPDLQCVRLAVTSILKPAEDIYFTATTPTKPALTWRENGGEPEERLISQLSDGYRNMLALVMDFARRLAQANPQLEDPLAAEAIMLVDEIDLHLHPRWQQTILEDLRGTFPNTQIIVTTHSPQVLTTVQSRCIRILDDGQVRAAPPASDGAESARLLERIMGVPSRPQSNPHARSLKRLQQLIADHKLDEATQVLESLKEWSQGEEPELIGAEMEIANRRWEDSESAAG